MLESGYILLHRSLLDWEWYPDQNTKTLFLHPLLTVNYQDKPWRGLVIRRGQRVCGYETLAEETHLSVKCVRTAIKHLKGTGEVAHQANPQYGLFPVLNYDKYQQRAPNGAPEGQSEGSQGAVSGHLLKESKKAKKAKKAKKERSPSPPTVGLQNFGGRIPKR